MGDPVCAEEHMLITNFEECLQSATCNGFFDLSVMPMTEDIILWHEHDYCDVNPAYDRKRSAARMRHSLETATSVERTDFWSG